MKKLVVDVITGVAVLVPLTDAEVAAVGEPPDPLPTLVTRRQARQALRQTGMLGAVEAYMAVQSEEAQIDWEDATEFDINHPTIELARVGLGLTDDDILGLFAIAGSIT